MLLNRWNVAAIVGLASVLALLIASSILSPASDVASFPAPAATAATRASWDDNTSAQVERSRIHAHFDSVLIELESRDVSMLSPAQRAARGALVRTLQSYNARGVFPRNYDFASAPTPYFVDRKTGTLCAVAFLLESTGERALVDRVARSNNNIWVAELAEDAEFTRWLANHGISLDEAARIQVPYVMSESAQQREIALSVAAPVSLLASVGSATYNAWGNADGHSRVGNILGLSSGVLATLFNARYVSGRDNTGPIRGIASAGVAVGGLGIALSTRALMRRSRTLAVKRDAERAETLRRASASASIAPIVPIGRNGGAGVSVALRF